VVFTVQHRTNLCNVVVHGFVLRSLIGSSSQLCDTIPTVPKRGCGGIIRPSICLPFTTGWLHPRFPIRLGLTDPHGFKYANANGFFSRSFPPVTVQRPPQPDDQRNAKNPQSLARHRCAQRFPFRSPSSLQRVDAVPRCFFFFFNSNERTNEPKTSGAASGLGLALTKNILARGDNVVATGRSASQFHDLLSDASIDQTRLRVLALDVTAPFAEIKRRMDTAIEVWGRLDVVVNNAGIAVFGTTEEIGSVLIHLQTLFFSCCCCCYCYCYCSLTHRG